MFTLLKKDLSFNYFHFIIAIALTIIIPVGFYIEDAGNFAYWMYFFAPFMACVIYINRVCYTDDAPITRMFLKSLPIKRIALVLSKYINAVFILILAMLIISVCSLLLGLTFSLGGILLSFSFLMFYYSIYMFLYFRFNYNAAQKTSIIIVFISMGIAAIVGRLDIAIEFGIIDNAIFIIACIIFSLTAIVVSVRASLKR